MHRNTQLAARSIHQAVVGILALAAVLFSAASAAASPPWTDPLIELEGATGAEGIAAGEGTTFFAGDRILGDIYRGDIREGAASLFIDAPDSEMREAAGMKFDARNDLLFVAGGSTGQAYVYDTNTGATVAVIQLTTDPAFINDVALTRDGAWFTNSAQGELYFVPVSKSGDLGSVQTLTLSGPAADTESQFNLNGIAVAADGQTLIVAHSGNGALYTVDPVTGESALIAGVSVPNVDGIVVRGNQLWAVQNFINQVSRIQLSEGLTSGTLRGSPIVSSDFSTPTTAALFGNTLAVVNAKFANPAATVFDVALVPAR